MTESTPNLFSREDTFFGVCQGLGDDIGVPADLVRVAAAALFFLAPLPTFVGYFVIGAIILAARLAFPMPMPSAIRTEDSDIEAGSETLGTDHAAAEEFVFSQAA